MAMNKEQVLELVDFIMHMHASSYRNEAREIVEEKFNSAAQICVKTFTNRRFAMAEKSGWGETRVYTCHECPGNDHPCELMVDATRPPEQCCYEGSIVAKWDCKPLKQRKAQIYSR